MMPQSSENSASGENRRFARVVWSQSIHYCYGSGERGEAMVGDVGRGGFRVRMGRYLRPGTRMLVQVPAWSREMTPLELKAEVAWCAPSRMFHEFEAGLRIIYDEPDVFIVTSALVHRALFSLCDGPFVSESDMHKEEESNPLPAEWQAGSTPGARESNPRALAGGW